mmetsp:Transcript_26329/g.23282  ORF Transcript_26329/g.23282 Transcript_26329/m.23282 type:complete len:299 (+) Transcript_26329:501-1397(+)
MEKKIKRLNFEHKEEIRRTKEELKEVLNQHQRETSDLTQAKEGCELVLQRCEHHLEILAGLIDGTNEDVVSDILPLHDSLIDLDGSDQDNQEVSPIDEQFNNVTENIYKQINSSGKDKEELKKREQDCKTLKDEIIELEKKYENIKVEFNYYKPISQKALQTQLQDLYTQHIGSAKVDKNFNLELNLKTTSHQNLIRVLKDTKLPIIDTVRLYNIGYFNEPEILNKFMKESIHQRTKEFYFQNDGSKLTHPECQDYLEAIKSVADKVHELLHLSMFRMNKEDFEDILISAKNCKNIDM